MSVPTPFWFALGVFFAWFLVVNYISIILHRSIAHRAIHLPTWWTYSVMTLCNMTILYMNPRTWVADHRMHHAFSDSEKDPDKHPDHTFWPWLGYILTHQASPQDDMIQKMTQDAVFKTPIFRLFSDLRMRGVCEVTCFLTPCLIARSVWIGALFWASVRLMGIGALCLQSYFGHGHHLEVGYRNYEDTNDDSVNINNPIALILTGGECLQNNHHKQPRRPTHAHKDNEWDVGYTIVRLLYLLRIARPAVANIANPMSGSDQAKA